MTKRRILAYVAAVLLVLIAAAAALEWRNVTRLIFVRRLFSGANQVEHFRSMPSIFPVHVVHKASAPFQFASGTPLVLPASFAFAGGSEDTAAFLAGTDTTGLLILHEDKLVYEQYWLGNNAGTQWIAWSVSKSFTSALFGIAVRSGAIGSVEDAVTRYVPELKGGAYEGTRIKDVLQMSSGASWNEDYSNPESDINRFGRTFALGGSLDAFAATLTRQYQPGTFNRYNTMDSQVIGMILRRATGKTETEYLQEQIWSPLGMESDAYWITDDNGAEFAGGGLNATLRDFAKLGRLYLHGGNWNGTQIIPAEWVQASVTPDAPHLMPGKRASSDAVWGYGYQWWIPDNSGAFSAIGIFNQFVYVNPALHLVIAKTSANHRYGTANDESSDREAEHFAFFKAIEKSLASPSTISGGGN